MIKVTAENKDIKIELDVKVLVKNTLKVGPDAPERVLNVIGKMFIDQDFGIREIKFIEKK